MPDNTRSKRITAGVQRAPNRAMLRAVGFGDADFDKPIVGIANAYSTITPCNAGLNELALRAERALHESGAMPQLFGTITVSDGISMGTEGMKYSLVSREVIADSIETVCNAQAMDGVIAIGGCDKNMPGALMALPASLLAGVLWSSISPAAPFAFGAAMATLAIVALRFVPALTGRNDQAT
jgi:dihydroxy-acid dehydratase